MFRSLILFFYLLAAGLVSAQSGFTSPFKFIENQGQWNDMIQYQVAVPSGSIYMLKDKIVYDLIDRGAIHDLKTGEHNQHPSSNTMLASVSSSVATAGEMIDAHTFSAAFVNSNPEVSIYPSFKTREYYSYFLGNDSQDWASKIHGHYILNYEDLYENINVSYYATSMGLKYDFLVKPGGCVEDIVIDYTGVEVDLDTLGNLWMRTSLGDIIEQKPIAYQNINGEKVDVEVSFLLENFTLRFEVSETYDDTFPLIIDPLLIFSTYSGSPADNWGNTATFDEKGNLYSGGITNHVRGGVTLGEFPATEGAYQVEWGGIWDVSILKYDSAGGELLYATYLGGSGSETPHSTIVNEDGELIIFGTTESSNFPTSFGAYQTDFAGGFPVQTTIPYSSGTDLFIAKLSEDGGSLLSSTYLGGSGNDGVNRIDDPLTRNYGDELRGDVNVDDSGNIYITTSTSSSDLFEGIDTSKVIRGFAGGVTDGMIAKFTPDLRFLQWGSFL